MEWENSRKIKLLKLYELLRQETDEENAMTTESVLRRLGEMGIPCDRRTLARDIAVLNEFDYEVMSCRVGKQNAYYVADRSFSVPELKLLIDAVQAASCVTEKKTRELVAKLADLGGSHRADILKKNMVRFNTRKHTNEKIFYIVGDLEEALEQQKCIAFRYCDLNECGERVYRRDGAEYFAEPLALVYNEDNYYLAAMTAEHEGITTYRVDRMDGVRQTGQRISEAALEQRARVGAHTEQAFKMYGGAPERITIRFYNELIPSVYDKFGENTTMIRYDETTCVATVKVQISPTFWGWLFQFAGKMQITEPKSVIEAYKAQGERLNALE